MPPQRPSVADTATISQASQAALATLTGGTSPTQPDDTYNFSDMTSKQAISAAGQLATKGIITGDQFATIAGETPALSTVPIDGYQPGSPDPLDSSVTSNYLQLTQESISSLESYGGSDPAVKKTLGLYESVLPVLTQLQNQYDSSIGSQTAGTLLNQQA